LSKPVFHRPQLAKEVTNLALGRTSLVRAGAALFLAAARRTGKTTFLLEDLTPALQSEGVHVIYIDLGADVSLPPSALIAEAAERDLEQRQGTEAEVSATIQATPVCGVRYDHPARRKKAGASIVDALKELQTALSKPIALIVDEAQHLGAEAKSTNVMGALKSACDALNVGEDRRLLLVMLGSHRDKLQRLVLTPGAPFFGAQIFDLPSLGREYSALVAGKLVQALPRLSLCNDLIDAIFDRFLRRPGHFEEAIGLAANPLAAPDSSFRDRLDAAADKYERMLDQEYEEAFVALSPVEAGVLRWILERGPGARLFTKNALAFYGRVVGRTVGAGSARDAVQSLRDVEPAVLWKNDRGDYVLENTDLLRWYRNRRDAGLWVPG
jgi:hypothetical protein